MLPSLLIVDDFLADPWSARAQALALDFDPAQQFGNFPGRNSTTALPTEHIDGAVSRLISQQVRGAAGTNHGHCRITLRADKGKSGVHIDPAAYSGILYLSRPEDCAKPNAGGTDFFRHKRTGLERAPTDLPGAQAAGYLDPNALIDGVVNQDTTKPAKWERVMRVPARFNRLLLFSPWHFHNAAPGFGQTDEDGRLVMLLFFEMALDTMG
ncbi:DUF6445 family protein [Qipengyuania sp. DGS5-3]|uniref:DUF6445 family protein n=1 Tax=Qipengyuania sp. DGS5-3 TaxID=3349632 RepID=UPI0036D2741C